MKPSGKGLEVPVVGCYNGDCLGCWQRCDAGGSVIVSSLRCYCLLCNLCLDWLDLWF